MSPFFLFTVFSPKTAFVDNGNESHTVICGGLSIAIPVILICTRRADPSQATGMTLPL